MKEGLKKILKKLKKASKWILRNIKYILLVVGSLLAVMTVRQLIANIGKVKEHQNWEPVKGDKTKVFVWDKDNNKKVVKLPVNPRTGKQVRNDEIKALGLAEGNKEALYVEILHTPINRR